MRVSSRLFVFTVLSFSAASEAKPIAFAHGTTAMAEYGAETMEEAQVFYAPSYRFSVGGTYLALHSELNAQERDIVYGRVNYLPKRWNRENSQANVFVWAGAGSARLETKESVFAWNTGGQVDYETRRIYASLRTDLHKSSSYEHRLDTLQLGFAPYKHDYGSYALWFVGQARQYSGRLYDGIEYAALIRVFKGSAWFEAGATQDGKLQAMMMFNF